VQAPFGWQQAPSSSGHPCAAHGVPTPSHREGAVQCASLVVTHEPSSVQQPPSLGRGQVFGLQVVSSTSHSAVGSSRQVDSNVNAHSPLGRQQAAVGSWHGLGEQVPPETQESLAQPSR
jgi:hypothetical protein